MQQRQERDTARVAAEGSDERRVTADGVLARHDLRLRGVLHSVQLQIGRRRAHPQLRVDVLLPVIMRCSQAVRVASAVVSETPSGMQNELDC